MWEPLECSLLPTMHLLITYSTEASHEGRNISTKKNAYYRALEVTIKIGARKNQIL